MKRTFALAVLLIALATTGYAQNEREKIPPEALDAVGKLSPAISADDLRTSAVAD